MTAAMLDRAHETFPPQAESVAAARRFVRAALAGWSVPQLVDSAVLLTSELVTNAIVHAGTEVTVTCSRDGTGVRIEIGDHHPARLVPLMPATPDDDSEGGRGLLLAAEIADAWGVDYDRTHKRLWFRLALRSAGGDRGPAALRAVTQETLPASPAGPAQAPEVASWQLDGDGRVLHWSPAAERLLGWSEADAASLALDALVADPPPGLDPPELLTLARWQGVCGLRRRDGGLAEVFVSQLRTVDDDGSPRITMLAVPRDLRVLLQAARGPPPRAGCTGPGQAAPLADEAWEGLTEAVTARMGLDELLPRVLERARDVLEADAAFLLLTTEDDDEVEVRATSGLPSSALRSPRFGLADALGTLRMPVVRDDLGERALLPVLEDSGVRSLVSVPLLVEGRVTGALAVGSRQRSRFRTEDALTLQRAADRIALGVESARLAELEHQRRGWVSFLAEASELLASTLHPQMTQAIIAQLVVPRLATWCGLYDVDDAGRPHLAYVWHADESRIDEVREALDRLAEPPVRRPFVIPEPGCCGGDVAVTLPLAARGRRTGLLTMGRPAGTRFGRSELELAEDLVRRAALALDNARLYAHQSATSQALQRSLLPEGVPQLPGCEVGVVYEAAGEGTEVGGDFYDVFAIDDGCWGFAIGDVCGKGAEAAAVTGLARHTLRLLTRRGDPIPAALAQLNAAILAEGARARFVTLLAGRARPLSGGGLQLEFACAGHPLPLRVRPDGAVEPVGTPQPLLGVLDDLDETGIVTDTVTLDPGQALVCFTDGVTERRDGERMLGEDGLIAVLRPVAGLPAAAVATRVRRAVVDYAPGPPRDDMAVLVLRAAVTSR